MDRNLFHKWSYRNLWWVKLNSFKYKNENKMIEWCKDKFDFFKKVITNALRLSSPLTKLVDCRFPHYFNNVNNCVQYLTTNSKSHRGALQIIPNSDPFKIIRIPTFLSFLLRSLAFHIYIDRFILRFFCIHVFFGPRINCSDLYLLLFWILLWVFWWSTFWASGGWLLKIRIEFGVVARFKIGFFFLGRILSSRLKSLYNFESRLIIVCFLLAHFWAGIYNWSGFWILIIGFWKFNRKIQSWVADW